jgi:hypothetical protein
MIERYTIKFGPAVSQKELEKMLLGDATKPEGLKKLHRMKARVGLVADAEDIRAIGDFLKEHSQA